VRILMFSHGYPPTISGVTLVVQKIARAMVSRGHQVLVVTGSECYTPYQDEDQGVRLVRLPGVPNPFWREGPLPLISSRTICKMVDQFQPDIIHTHENAVLNNSLMSLKWDSHPVLIYSCYYLPRYITHYLHFGPLDAQFETLAWNLAVKNLNRFKHVVFCTRTLESDFRPHGLLAPTTVISNGVNIQRYCPEKDPGEDIERRYSLPPAPRILSVGRLMKDKRLELLVRAMSRVVAEREAHLLMVGVGTERPHLEALIHRLKLEPYIHIVRIGDISHQNPGIKSPLNIN
jgi:glycosyltransferase involved in cell wall biosynthesis